MNSYSVIFEEGPETWGAWVPDLPGCVAAAKTREETQMLIQEAMRAYIDYLKENNLSVPTPHHHVELVAA